MPTPTTISSHQNPLIRQVLRLRDNRWRQRQRAVLVDGVREIRRAISGGLRLRHLFVAEAEAENDEADESQRNTDTRRLVAAAGTATVTVTGGLMERIAYGNPRGAVAVFETPPDDSLDALVLPESPLVIILVAIEKPGNIGAIFRSADAIGADAVVLCDTVSDRFNPNLIRASLGTVFSVPTAAAGLTATLEWIRRHSLTCCTTVVTAERTFWDVDYRRPTAIVMGAESTGLGEPWTTQTGAVPSVDTIAVSIPMLGVADSLNVSVAAAALMFEASRQRRREGSRFDSDIRKNR